MAPVGGFSRRNDARFLILLNPDYFYPPAMFMWIIISAFLIIGLALLFVEVIFIPGTTLVGLLGFIFIVAGIVITYKHFGNDIGLYVLIGTSILTVVTLVYSFRAGTWSKFSLKSAIDSKVNEGETALLQIGDTGVTTSTLRPIGKAEFRNRQYEVKTSGNYLDPGKEIRITQILLNQIIVEPIN
jgi:membrane-bound ClpP family serine protease